MFCSLTAKNSYWTIDRNQKKLSAILIKSFNETKIQRNRNPFVDFPTLVLLPSKECHMPDMIPYISKSNTKTKHK